MGNLFSMFGRLSKRERILVSTMFLLLFGSLFVFLNLWFASSLEEMEEKITDGKKTLIEIYGKSGGFLEGKRHATDLRELASRNKALNLKLAVNELAKKTSFEAFDRKGESEGMKKLSDVMQFDKTQEAFVSKKKKQKRGRKAKGKNKKDAEAGYYRKDQPITFSAIVPFQAIYDLLERIEESNQLLFVTDMRMSRDFKDGRQARKNASVTVSTYFYKGASKGREKGGKP
jgi:hypothetical protein